MPHKYGKSAGQGEKKISLNQQDFSNFAWLFSIAIIPLALVGYEMNRAPSWLSASCRIQRALVE